MPATKMQSNEAIYDLRLQRLLRTRTTTENDDRYLRGTSSSDRTVRCSAMTEVSKGLPLIFRLKLTHPAVRSFGVSDL